jgi:hypothetical protein
MKQEIIDNIIKDYKDYKKMVENDFQELNEEFTTPGRIKRVSKIKEKHESWVTSEDIDINDNILDEAINSNLVGTEVGDTNKVLIYISELTYDTYKKIFKDELEMSCTNPNAIYVLYMDIEDNSKYFIQKEYQEEFEKSHNVIVKYKNPNCNAGWNFDRNYYDEVKEARREFIIGTMENTQEDAAKELIMKYNKKD